MSFIFPVHPALSRRRIRQNKQMVCCDDFQNLVDQEFARVQPKHLLSGGRIMNDIDTDYFFVFGAERPSFIGMNYCPFCGRVVSRGLWNLEKKK